MSSVAPKKVLDLSDKLEQGHIHPTRGVISYLGLVDGPTDTLVFASILDQSRCDTALNKVIEVVFSVLNKGDFKVGQLPLVGEFLVKCTSPEDANKLHHQVKVCYRTIIGFRKLERVYVVPEMADIVLSKTRDANPDEYKLQKEPGESVKQMKNILEKYGSKVATSKDELDSAAPLDDPAAGGTKKRKGVKSFLV